MSTYTQPHYFKHYQTGHIVEKLNIDYGVVSFILDGITKSMVFKAFLASYRKVN